MTRRTVYLTKIRYRSGVPLRDDLAHLINTNTVERAEMLESGVKREIVTGQELVYHDVRLYFNKATRS